MGIKSFIDNKIQQGIDIAVERQMQAQLRAQTVRWNFISEYDAQRNYAWYMGDQYLLDFYKYNNPYSASDASIHNTTFWKTVKHWEQPVVHSGLPNLLSRTIGRILFHNGIKVDNENDTYLAKVATEMAICYSYSGFVAVRLNPNEQFSVHSALDSKYDAVNDEIVFITRFVEGKTTFQLHECRGWGYNMNLLYVEKEGQLVPCELTAVSKTAGLLPREDFNKNIRCAVYIQGKSLYNGSYDLFDMLDEAYSNMKDLSRRTKPMTYVPESLQLKTKSGYVIGWDPNQTIYTAIGNDLTETAQNKIQTEAPKVDVNKEMDIIKTATEQILINFGISPASLGKEVKLGSVGYEARRLMESATLRTREDLLNIFKPAVEELYRAIVNTQAAFEKKLPMLSTQELDIHIEDYIIDGGSITREMALQLYREGIMSLQEVRAFYELTESTEGQTFKQGPGSTATLDFVNRKNL